MIRNFIFCFALLFSATSFAQAFDLNVTPTVENCYGTATISVSVANTQPGVTIDYVLYRMPNDTNPVAYWQIGPSGAPDYAHTFTSITAGDYKVSATQTLGAPLNTQIEDVTVVNSGNNISLSPQTSSFSRGIKCGEDGFISVEITQGTAEWYRLRREQSDGTFVVVAGPQDGGETSTIFENLTPGHYRVDIKDVSCPELLVRTVFLDPVDMPLPSLGDFEFTPVLDGCETASVSIESSAQIPLIAFPVDITITVNHPSGNSDDNTVIEMLNVQADGTDDPQAVAIEEFIPYYQGEYSITVVISNECSWWIYQDTYPVVFELEVQAKMSEKICNGIDISVSNAIGSYKVEFLDREAYLLDNTNHIPIATGHISPGMPTVGAVVHSYDPIDEDNDTVDYPNPPYIFTLTHNGTASDYFPVEAQGGAGEVTYGIYDEWYWLDPITPYSVVNEADVEYDEGNPPGTGTGRLILSGSTPPKNVYISIDEVTEEEIYLVSNYIYVNIEDATDTIMYGEPGYNQIHEFLGGHYDGEDYVRRPILVGEYVIKVTDECDIWGIVDTFALTDEVAAPNITLKAMPTLPNSGDPFLDCIPVGDVEIVHALFFDWGLDQDFEYLEHNIGKVEIIGAPSDYLLFLADYTTNPATGSPYTLPLDITEFVGLPKLEQIDQGIDPPAPPFPNQVFYPEPTGPGQTRPLFPGLVGINDINGNHGIYTFRLTDICGNSWELSEELLPYIDLTSPSAFDINVRQGCDGIDPTTGDPVKLGSVEIQATFDETIGSPVYTIVEEAPDAFYDEYYFMEVVDSTSPFFGEIDLVNQVYEDGDKVLGYWYYVEPAEPGQPGFWHFRIGNLPAGHYKFNVKIGCAEVLLEFDIEGYLQSTQPLPEDNTEDDYYELKKYCGVFSLYFEYTSNVDDLEPEYKLQYCGEGIDYDDCTWVDVMIVNPDGTESLKLIERGVWNNEIDYGNGTYRIVKSIPNSYNDPYGMFGTPGNGIDYCDVFVHWFEYEENPGIISIDPFSCPDGESLVIVNATGAEPLTYQLISVDEDANGDYIPGSEVVIYDNEESNVFSGDSDEYELIPGNKYWFQVTDECGATVAGSATIAEPVPFEIIEDNLCDGTEDPLCAGSDGCLSVDYLAVLLYEWYKLDDNGNEIPVLDDNGDHVVGNQLHFAPYSCADAGTYRVKMTVAGNEDLAFCDVNHIDYTLSCQAPNAGDDVTRTYCHTDQSINLDDLLTDDADSGGTWTDVDGTGGLNGSVFNTTGVAFGTYEFLYTVGGGCSGQDSATITIELLDTPALPVIEPITPVCEGEDAVLTIDSPNSAFTYTWTYPDGATNTGTSITVSTAGEYSVVATLTGTDCVSPSATATAVINPLPDFAITGNLEICPGEMTTLSVSGDNFSNSDATFEWTADGNVIGTSSSILVDDLGHYMVTVTLNDCEFSRSVTVVENTDMPDVVIEEGCVNNQFELSVANTSDFPGATYQWTVDGNPVSTDSTINFVTLSLEAGAYAVTVTSPAGCTVSESITVSDTQCMIPKGVSPNGDTINDYFDLSNFDVKELKIFNRYGVTVYEATNYKKEWEGQSTNGNELPSATYYYVVTMNDGEQRSGWVYLNRAE